MALQWHTQFLMIGLVGQLAARRPQVALLWRLPMDWQFSILSNGNNRPIDCFNRLINITIPMNEKFMNLPHFRFLQVIGHR